MKIKHCLILTLVAFVAAAAVLGATVLPLVKDIQEQTVGASRVFGANIAHILAAPIIRIGVLLLTISSLVFAVRGVIKEHAKWLAWSLIVLLNLLSFSTAIGACWLGYVVPALLHDLARH